MPLYIEHSGDLEGCHACLTDSHLKDRATQLLIKYKSGALRRNIHEMFYTNKIPEYFSFTREKRFNCDNLGNKKEKIGCFYLSFLTNTNSLLLTF